MIINGIEFSENELAQWDRTVRDTNIKISLVSKLFRKISLVCARALPFQRRPTNGLSKN